MAGRYSLHQPKVPQDGAGSSAKLMGADSVRLASHLSFQPLALALIRVLCWVVVIASLGVFGWMLNQAVSSAGSLTAARWSPLVAAVCLQLVMLLWLMVAWDKLLSVLWSPECGARKPARWSMYAAYSASWLTRYIPGRIWSLGGRALLANRRGVPVALVSRSMFIEVGFTYTLIIILAGALLLGEKWHPLAGLALGLGGVSLFTLALVKGNWLWNSLLCNRTGLGLIGVGFTHVRRLALGDASITLQDMLRGVLAYGLYAGAQLGLIVLIAAAFTELSPGQAAVIAGAWGLSLTLGWLTFLTPLGLGVREGLAVALFLPVLDANTSVLIVTTARLVSLALDLFFVVLVQGLSLCLGPKGGSESYPHWS